MLWMLLSAAMAMASFVSCSQDETVDSAEEIIESVADVPVEVDGYASTRGVVVDDGATLEMWWGPKESIGVYGSGMKNTKYTGTNKYKNASTTTFSGGSLFSSPKYAYYPYSATNSANAQTDVRGAIAQQQSYNTSVRRMNTDYKIGKYASRTLTATKFNFSHVLTFVKFAVDATDTQLEGEKIQSITMTVTAADKSVRQLWGDFTMDLTQSAAKALSWDAPMEGANTMVLAWADTPALKADKAYAAYMSAAPVVKKGDTIAFEILTENYKATFTRTSQVDYAANLLVNYPMSLADIADLEIVNLNEEEGDEDDGNEDQPGSAELVINSFKFEVANNPGKILGKKLAWNSSQNKTLPTTVTEVVCEVDNVNRTIKAFIPYLNDRKLVPTFDIPEGLVLGQSDIAVSGETVIDFGADNQVALLDVDKGEFAIYTVELTNTGLPVVVINQESGTTDSEDNADYQKASAAWYAATGAKWQPKNSDWEISDVTKDNFMVYNADGTSALSASDVPVLASTRVRGNVTQQMPKKAFAVKLDKKSGVLDMPAHKRWVLLANWKDRTLLRNEVAFGLAEVFQNTFNDGMAWNPSGQHVELVYNGVHVGNYYLCEQIKIDGNRLDINDPYDKDDAVGDPASYGYLLENDDAIEEDNSSNLMSTGTGDCWFYTKNYIPFIFKDDLDSDGSSSSTLRTYAQDFVRGVEEELYKNTTAGYSAAFAKMNLASFVDYWLVQELMLNSETSQPKSCYMNINNGIISAGPLWDFDWNTLPVSNYSEMSYSYSKSMLETAKPYHRSSGYPTKQYSSSSFFSSSTDESYLWYPMLVKSADFKNLAAQRWAQVKGALTAYANSIPAMAEKLAKSADVNDDIWFLDNKSMNSNHRGTLYGIGGNYSQNLATRGYCGDEAMTFEAAAENLSTLLKQRISGMSYVESKTWPSKSYNSSSK